MEYGASIEFRTPPLQAGAWNQPNVGSSRKKFADIRGAKKKKGMCANKVFSFHKSCFLTHTLARTGRIYVNTTKSGFLFIGVEWLNALLRPLELCWSPRHQIEAICPLPPLLACERRGR